MTQPEQPIQPQDTKERRNPELQKQQPKDPPQSSGKSNAGTRESTPAAGENMNRQQR